MTGEELRAIRHAAGLSASQLAQAIGVHERTIYKWERGERKITHFVADAIQRWCAARRQATS